MKSIRRQPLLVHLVFHPDSEKARELARRIHLHLNGDGMVPGLKVPTIFSGREDLSRETPRIGKAEKDVVVVLADDYLMVDDEWCCNVGDLWENCISCGSRFVPIQLSRNAWPLDRRLAGVSFARAFDHPEGRFRDAWIIRRIVVELCRYLANLSPIGESGFGVPVKVFLSHAKSDLRKGGQVTEEVIGALSADQPIESWVDSGSIPTGSEFAKAIYKGIDGTSLLVILTDAYTSREWCREEVLLAKERQRPVAVIDALESFEARSYPYLGNVPRIRWDGDPQRGIDLLLKESLRHLHELKVLNLQKDEGDVVFARAPEFLTLIGLESEKTVLYPDPPVGIGEQKRLKRAGVPFVTPLQRLARKRSLAGVSIALSMSESTDIASQGLDPLHLECCMIELSRYLLIKGATLAYGGHIGEEGYTRKLHELVRENNEFEGVEPSDRILNIRSWPFPKLTVEQEAQLKRFATTITLSRPDDIDESLHVDFVSDPQFFSADQSAEHRFAWARGMTEMRAYQADRVESGVAARIVIGGTFGPTIKAGEGCSTTEKWYAGRIPGVLEEIVLSIQKEQPVFLVGAFGGVGKLVIDLLRGLERVEASWDYQKKAPYSEEMRDLYRDRGANWIDYPEIVNLICEKGVEGINPLLKTEEQDELFDAVDPVWITELVLRGLERLG